MLSYLSSQQPKLHNALKGEHSRKVSEDFKSMEHNEEQKVVLGKGRGAVPTFLIVGHCDAGKSTLLGHLYLKCGGIGMRSFRKLQTEATYTGRGSLCFAWLAERNNLDAQKSDRTCRLQFKTPSSTEINMIEQGRRGPAIPADRTIDCIIIAVGLPVGELESALSRSGGLDISLDTANLLGITNFIIAATKIDAAGVAYTRARYDEAKLEIGRVFKKKGIDFEMTPVIPVSAFKGDNLLERSENTPWYDGPTLMQAIDGFALRKMALRP
jgi:elongation factor 1-alpha